MTTRATYVQDPEFHLGDAVWYDPIPRVGGSGFQIRTRAIFIRRTKQKAIIKTLRHDGTSERLVVARPRLMRREP